MDEWVDYLHVEFLGEHILFRFLRLQSFWSFILGSIVITVICLVERFLTVLLNKKIQPSTVRHSRLGIAAWRGVMYGFVTFLRLLYMLVAMSSQLGVIAIVVIALSIGQFAIEYVEYQEPSSGGQAEEPLIGTSFERRHPIGRSRTRSKPDDILIHPSESNLARADAFALELGIGSDTELVQGNRADGQSWQLGKGRDVARKAFGGSYSRLTDSDTGVFDVGDDGGDRSL
ncbi:copper transporter [Boletus coccyginus]|nr:copper transporter [Boletus coccyginus]